MLLQALFLKFNANKKSTALLHTEQDFLCVLKLFSTFYGKKSTKVDFFPVYCEKRTILHSKMTLLKSCCFFLAHDFKSPLLDIETIISNFHFHLILFFPQIQNFVGGNRIQINGIRRKCFI